MTTRHPHSDITIATIALAAALALTILWIRK